MGNKWLFSRDQVKPLKQSNIHSTQGLPQILHSQINTFLTSGCVYGTWVEWALSGHQRRMHSGVLSWQHRCLAFVGKNVHPQTYTSLFSDTHTLTPTLGTPMRPFLNTPLPSLEVWQANLILWISAKRKPPSLDSLHPHQSLYVQLWVLQHRTHLGGHWSTRLGNYWFVFILDKSFQRDTPRHS